MQAQLYDYSLIGGDLRQVFLAEELARPYSRLCHYALCGEPEKSRCAPSASLTPPASLAELCHSSPNIICPIPLSRDGITLNQSGLEEEISLRQLLDQLQPDQHFFAGSIPADFQKTARARGIYVHDLMEDAALAWFNTLATAEGAICEAIISSPINLHKSHCLILGYGKCGKALAQYLKGMFCCLDILTDDVAEQAQASLTANRTGALVDMEKQISDYDFIFNTVPALILTAPLLEKAKPGVTIIDIASAPGGVDFPTARKLNLTAKSALGLPGKYAPASSARGISAAIKTILKEKTKCL